MKSPELLAPAGTLKNLRYALAFGADAVYAGMPRYSLRVRNNDFSTLPALKQGIDYTHSLGRKFFLATNISPHQAKLRTFLEDMAPIMKLNPDALIMADPGLIMMIRENWPDMPVHLSVQANAVNAQTVKFWKSIGLSRVILSRELSLDEVALIRQECPDMELEVFIHGALCMAYSGRCLLSGYFNHRDANQGSCTNSCRWDYKVSKEPEVNKALDEAVPVQIFNAEDIQNGPGLEPGQPRHPEADEIYLIEEKNRPGEHMPIFEDEHGTYIMNSKDLRALEHVERLVQIGVDSLKIEGRTKSHYYASRTSSVYRRAIDAVVAGEKVSAELFRELDGLANRGYTDAFYQRHKPQELQNYEQNASKNDKEIFVAEVGAMDADSGWAEVEVKNRLQVGDELELLTPTGNRRFVLEAMRNAKGHDVDVVPGSGQKASILLPEAAAPYSLVSRHL